MCPLSSTSLGSLCLLLSYCFAHISLELFKILAKMKRLNLRSGFQTTPVHFIAAGTDPCAQGALSEKEGITQL